MFSKTMWLSIHVLTKLLLCHTIAVKSRTKGHGTFDYYLTDFKVRSTPPTQKSRYMYYAKVSWVYNICICLRVMSLNKAKQMLKK